MKYNSKVYERANGLNIRLGQARLPFSRFERGEKQGAFWRDESGESFFFYCEHIISLIHECYFSARNNIFFFVGVSQQTLVS